MPGTIDIPNNALPFYFSSYVQIYVERDVRLLENIENPSQFGTFLSLLGALTSQEINYSQIGRELGVAPKNHATLAATVSTYLSMVRTATISYEHY